MKDETIQIAKIRINPASVIDWKFVKELAISIGTIGLLQKPVVERKVGHFYCTIGRHRILACRALGMSVVDCVVIEKPSDEASKLMSIESNLRRKPIKEDDRLAMETISEKIVMSSLGRGYHPSMKKLLAGILSFIRVTREKAEYKDALSIASRPIGYGSRMENVVRELCPEADANLKMTRFYNDKHVKKSLKTYGDSDAIKLTRIMMMYPDSSYEDCVNHLLYANKSNKVNWPKELDVVIGKAKPSVIRLLNVIKKVRLEVVKYRNHISTQDRSYQIGRQMAVIDIRLAEIGKHIKEKCIPYAICGQCKGTGIRREPDSVLKLKCKNCMGDGWIDEETTTTEEKFRE